MEGGADHGPWRPCSDTRDPAGEGRCDLAVRGCCRTSGQRSIQVTRTRLWYLPRAALDGHGRWECAPSRLALSRSLSNWLNPLGPGLREWSMRPCPAGLDRGESLGGAVGRGPCLAGRARGAAITRGCTCPEGWKGTPRMAPWGRRAGLDGHPALCHCPVVRIVLVADAAHGRRGVVPRERDSAGACPRALLRFVRDPHFCGDCRSIVWPWVRMNLHATLPRRIDGSQHFVGVELLYGVRGERALTPGDRACPQRQSVSV